MGRDLECKKKKDLVLLEEAQRRLEKQFLNNKEKAQATKWKIDLFV